MTAPPTAPESLREFLGPRAVHLIPTHLTTVAELMAREMESLVAARAWTLKSGHKAVNSGTPFFMALHRRMYENIWSWAGQLRRTDHPEGVRWPTIALELNDLASEMRFWVERKLYSPDETALRLLHRLTRIRPWEGGNGAHARLAADALVVSLDQQPFLWGSSEEDSETSRIRYLAAMREGYLGRFQALRDFARGVTPTG